MYTDKGFLENFRKLGAVEKEFVNKDRDSPVIDTKIMALNRNTLPLYSKLDEKNKSILKPN